MRREKLEKRDKRREMKEKKGEKKEDRWKGGIDKALIKNW